MGRNSIAGRLLWLGPVLLLLLAVYIVFSALNGNAGRQPSMQAGASAAGFPKSIVESSGKKVLIPSRPMRIIPCNAGTADVVAALVDSGRIAAAPIQMLEFSGARDFYAKHTEIKRFEKFNAETLLGLQPDLVLASSFQDATVMVFLEEQHIPVMRLAYFQTFTGIRSSFLAIGNGVGEEEKARTLADEFERRLRAVGEAVAGLPKPRVLAYTNYGTGFAVGGGETQDEILRRTGARNAAAEAGLEGHQLFTFEQILKLDPDWLVLVGDEGLESRQVKILLNEPSLGRLRAIKERHIAVVPDRYFSAVSQYVVDAMEILARQIHPEAFVVK